MAEKTLYNAPSSNHIIANYDDDINVMRSNFQHSLARDSFAPYYKPFLPIAHSVFNGEDFEWAINQAKCIAKKAPQTVKGQRLALTQQKIAVEALETLEPYFSKDPAQWLKSTTVISFQATDKVQVPIKLYGIRRANSQTRICLFNYWQRNLNDQQISILVSLARHYTYQYPEFQDTPLEFIDISRPNLSKVREYRSYGWADFPPISDNDLNEIMKNLADAYVWAKQNKLEKAPRPPKPKPPSETGDLFTKL